MPSTSTPHRKPRRRRAGSAPLILLLLLIGAALFLLTRCARQERKTPSAGEDPAPPTTDTDISAPPQVLRRTTASGIACTLTEVDESTLNTGELLLVNNWTAYAFPQQQELVSIYEEKNTDYYVRDMEVYLSLAAMEPLNQMLADFRAQGGSKSINVVAGYRTAEVQQHLFDQSVQRNGLEHAEKYVAKSGGSEHHTGLAVDFSILNSDGTSDDYRGQGEYAWINENCGAYGFVVRYAQGKEELTGIYDEPWHFRYVGVPHALEITRRGLCLEEYLQLLRDYTFDGEHLSITCPDGQYEVWYTQGTAVYLPDTASYQLSGDNMGGAIVTCKVG